MVEQSYHKQSYILFHYFCNPSFLFSEFLFCAFDDLITKAVSGKISLGNDVICELDIHELTVEQAGDSILCFLNGGLYSLFLKSGGVPGIQSGSTSLSSYSSFDFEGLFSTKYK